MLSLFRMSTLDSWYIVMYINTIGCDSQYTGVDGVRILSALSISIKSFIINVFIFDCELDYVSPHNVHDRRSSLKSGIMAVLPTGTRMVHRPMDPAIGMQLLRPC